MTLYLSGHLLILWAFAANLVAGYGYFMAARGRTSYEQLGRRAYLVLAAATVLASALLYYLFFTHNFAFKYVFEYSDSRLPFFYLVSSFWGGQEGTYLLWLLFSVAIGFAVRRTAGRYASWAMVFYALVNLFFTGMMLKVSPFALLDFSAADGAGLNPLLQDPWMVVHPPVMFVGYALTGAPFALALAALVRRDFSEWVRRAAPWVVLTVLFLAAGNILGGYWAYKTLGWGGYWAWDPVENSSLIPWFVALALLHGLALERRTGALRRTNLLLAAFTFWLVVCGTFMTRSGVLSDFSVHSFVDLGQNEWLIVFLLLYAGVTLGVFLRGMRSTGYVPINFNFFGREFSLVGAMLLLFAFSLIVLFWSSLPILTKIFGAQPRAADIATYNAFALPIAVLYALLLILSPLSSHRPQAPAKWRIHLTAGGLVSLAVALMLFVLHEGSGVAFVVAGTLVATGLTVAFGQRDLRGSLIPAAALFVLALATALALGVRDGLYLLFFATAAAAVGSNAAAVARRLPGEWLKAGAHLTHFGFGLMLLGVLASSAFSTGERVTLPQGQPRPAYHLQVSYEGMQNDIKWPHNELILKVVDDGRVDEGRPELYFSERMNGYMKRPYIRRGLLYDLYFSPQDIKQQEGQDGLLIGKAEKASAGGYEFSFLGFDMGDHSGGGEMTVTALIAAARDGRVDTLRPAVTMATADDGSTALQDLPAAFGSGDSTFTMSITRIHADAGAVAVAIPGLLAPGAGDELLLDVSKKPLINLVWIGTTLILLGTLAAWLRRRRQTALAAESAAKGPGAETGDRPAVPFTRKQN